MANFDAVTASNEPRIMSVYLGTVQGIISKYTSSVSIVLENDVLCIYGYDWFQMYAPFDEDLDFLNEDISEDFLKEIAPYLAEPLIIHCVGSEKCRFPLSAIEITVTDGLIKYGGFAGNHEIKF